MKKQSFRLEKTSKEEFEKAVGNLEAGYFEFLYGGKTDLRKAYRLTADLIEDDWSVVDVNQQSGSILTTTKRRQKKSFVFPKGDNHFNRDKDRYQYHTLLASMPHILLKRKAIDIGGHIGLYSSALLEIFDQVIAFEPAPKNIECFRKNARRAELYELGLGDVEEVKKLKIADDNSGNNSLVEDFGQGEVAIQVKTLDSFNFENVDLLKIDVQGYEEQVLRGAKETIKNNKPVIIIELITHKNSPPNQAAMKLLEKFDYQVLSIIGKDYIMGKK